MVNYSVYNVNPDNCDKIFQSQEENDRFFITQHIVIHGRLYFKVMDGKAKKNLGYLNNEFCKRRLSKSLCDYYGKIVKLKIK